MTECVESAASPEFDDRMRAHAEQCRSCHQIWSEHQLLNSAIASWKSQATQVDLVDRVVSKWTFSAPKVETLTAPDRPSRPTSHGAACCIAAVSLIALLCLPVHRGAPEPRATIAHTPPPQTTEEVRELVADAGEAWWDLANNAANVFADATVFVSTANDAGAGQPGESDGEWPFTVEEWKVDFEPLSDEVGGALDFLIDALPESDRPTT